MVDVSGTPQPLTPSTPALPLTFALCGQNLTIRKVEWGSHLSVGTNQAFSF
jgi:hypothetical protein